MLTEKGFSVRDLAALTTVCSARSCLQDLLCAAALFDLLEILLLQPPKLSEDGADDVSDLTQQVRRQIAEVRTAAAQKLTTHGEKKLFDRFFVFWSAAKQVQWEEKLKQKERQKNKNQSNKKGTTTRMRRSSPGLLTSNPAARSAGEGESQKQNNKGKKSLEDEYLDQVLRDKVYGDQSKKKQNMRKKHQELAAHLEEHKDVEITLVRHDEETPRAEATPVPPPAPVVAQPQAASSSSAAKDDDVNEDLAAQIRMKNPVELPGTRAWEDVVAHSQKKIETLFHILAGTIEPHAGRLSALKEMMAHGNREFSGEDAYQRDLLLLEIRELEKEIFLEVSQDLLTAQGGARGAQSFASKVSGSFPNLKFPEEDLHETVDQHELGRQGVRTLRRLQVLWADLELYEISGAEAERVHMIRELSQVALKPAGTNDSTQEQQSTAKLRFLVENMVREQVQELETEILIAWGQEVLLQAEEHHGVVGDQDIELASPADAADSSSGFKEQQKRVSSMKLRSAGDHAAQRGFPLSSYFTRASLKEGSRFSALHKNSLLRVNTCTLPDQQEADLFADVAPSQNQAAKAVAVESLENLQLALVKYEGLGNYLEQQRRRSGSPGASSSMSVSRLFQSAREISIGVSVPNPAVCAIRRALVEQKRELETDVVLESMERKRRNLLAIEDSPQEPAANAAHESTLARMGSLAVQRIEALAVEVAETNFGATQTENRVAKQDSLATAQRFVEHIYELCDSEIPASSVNRDPKTQEVTIRMNRAAMAQVQHLEADALIGLSQKILENHLTWKTGRKTLPNTSGTSADNSMAVEASRRLQAASDRVLARVAKLRELQDQEQAGAGFVTDLSKLRQIELQLSHVATSMPGPQAAQLTRVGRMVHDLLQQVAVSDMQAVVLRRLAESGQARQLAAMDQLARAELLALQDRTSTAATPTAAPDAKTDKTQVKVHPLIQAQAIRTQARLRKLAANVPGDSASFSGAQLGIVGRISELGQMPDSTSVGAVSMLIDEIRELEAELMMSRKMQMVVGYKTKKATPPLTAEAAAAARACTRIANLFMESETSERQQDLLELMRDLSTTIAEAADASRTLDDLMLSLLRDVETEIVSGRLASEFPDIRTTSRNLAADDDASDWAFAVRRVGQKVDTLSHILAEFLDMTSHPAVARDVQLLQEMSSVGFEPTTLDLPILQDVSLLKMRELETGVLRFARDYVQLLLQQKRAGSQNAAAMKTALASWEADTGLFSASLGAGPASQRLSGIFPNVQIPALRPDDAFLKQEGIAALQRVKKLCTGLHMETAALAQADRALLLQFLCFETEASASSSMAQDPLALVNSRLENLTREQFRELESEIILGYGNAVLATNEDAENVGFLGVSSLLPWLMKNFGTAGAVDSANQPPLPDKLTVLNQQDTNFALGKKPLGAAPQMFSTDSRMTTRSFVGAASRSSVRALSSREDQEVFFLESQLFSVQAPTGNQYAKMRKIRELSLLDRSLSANADRLSGRMSDRSMRGTLPLGTGDGRTSATVAAPMTMLRRAICDQKRELETEVVLESMEVAEHELQIVKSNNKGTALASLAGTAVDRIEKCAMEVGQVYEYAGVEAEEAERLSEQRRTFFHTAFHFVEHIHDLAEAEIVPTAQLGVGRANEMVLKLNAAAARQLQHLEAQSVVSMAHNIMTHHSDRLMRDARAGARDSYLGGGARGKTNAASASGVASAKDFSSNATTSSAVALRTKTNLREQQRAASERALQRVQRVRDELKVPEDIIGLLPDLQDLCQIHTELAREAELLQRNGFLPQCEHVDRVARMVHDVLQDVAASDLLQLLARATRGEPLMLMDQPADVQLSKPAAPAAPAAAAVSSSGPQSPALPREILQNQLHNTEKRLDQSFGSLEKNAASTQQKALRAKIRELCQSYFDATKAEAMVSAGTTAGQPAVSQANIPTKAVPDEVQRKLGLFVADSIRELESQIYLSSAYRLSVALPQAPAGVMQLTNTTNANEQSRQSKAQAEDSSPALQSAKMALKRLETMFRDGPPNARQQDLFAQCLELYDGALVVAHQQTFVSEQDQQEIQALVAAMASQIKELQKEIVLENVQRAHERSAGGSTSSPALASEVRQGWENVNAAKRRSTASYIEQDLNNRNSSGNDDDLPLWMRELAGKKRGSDTTSASRSEQQAALLEQQQQQEQVLAQQNLQSKLPLELPMPQRSEAGASKEILLPEGEAQAAQSQKFGTVAGFQWAAPELGKDHPAADQQPLSPEARVFSPPVRSGAAAKGPPNPLFYSETSDETELIPRFRFSRDPDFLRLDLHEERCDDEKGQEREAVILQQPPSQELPIAAVEKTAVLNRDSPNFMRSLHHKLEQQISRTTPLLHFNFNTAQASTSSPLAKSLEQFQASLLGRPEEQSPHQETSDRNDGEQQFAAATPVGIADKKPPSSPQILEDNGPRPFRFGITAPSPLLRTTPVVRSSNAAKPLDRAALEEELRCKTSKNLELFQRVFELETQLKEQKQVVTPAVADDEQEIEAASLEKSVAFFPARIPEVSLSAENSASETAGQSLHVANYPRNKPLLFYNDDSRGSASTGAKKVSSPNRRPPSQPATLSRNQRATSSSSQRSAAASSTKKSSATAGFGSRSAYPFVPTGLLADLQHTSKSRRGARQEDLSPRTGSRMSKRSNSPKTTHRKSPSPKKLNPPANLYAARNRPTTSNSNSTFQGVKASVLSLASPDDSMASSAVAPVTRTPRGHDGEDGTLLHSLGKQWSYLLARYGKE
ncbi:unnamed protein product [Amoebophrya sp. A120]|nr:unnamed protein product [Amoebophrya sp. A120]|eukprot:GSA120T00004943001.1